MCYTNKIKTCLYNFTEGKREAICVLCSRMKGLEWHEWQNHHLGALNFLNTNMHTFTKHKKNHSLQVSLTRSELEIKINNWSATHRASRRCGEHSDPADLPQEPEPQPLRPNPDAPALQTREHRVTLHTRSCPEHTHTSVIEPLRPDPDAPALQTREHRVTLHTRSCPEHTHTSVIEPLRPDPDAPALQTREHRVTIHTRSCPEHTHFSYWAAPTRPRRSSPTDTRAHGHASHSVLPRTHTLQLLSLFNPIQTLQPYRHESTGSRFTLGPAQNTHTSVIEQLRPDPDAPALQTREHRVMLHTRSCPEHTHFSYWAAPTLDSLWLWAQTYGLSFQTHRCIHRRAENL